MHLPGVVTPGLKIKGFQPYVMSRTFILQNSHFMELKEQLKEIKTQLRLSMNGAVSQSMREKGVVYKLNFGVELPRIKSIAAA